MTQNERDLQLFSDYMELCGIAKLAFDPAEAPQLQGKKLGLLNGSAWVQLWCYYYGHKYLPGVKLVNAGNEAVQLNFMQAHEQGLRCPPQSNIEAFERSAKDLVELAQVDAILITCSTMNRSYDGVQRAVEPYGVPVLPVDQPMMQKAARGGGRILVVATHGPTVDSTRELLETAASQIGERNALTYYGAKTEEAFHRLGQGDVRGHNRCIEKAIRDAMAKQAVDKIVLAQMSMSVFKLEHPDCVQEFGVPVYTSGEEGFLQMRSLLMSL